MSTNHPIFLSFPFGIIGFMMIIIASGSNPLVSFRHPGCLISVRFRGMIKPEAQEAYSSDCSLEHQAYWPKAMIR